MGTFLCKCGEVIRTSGSIPNPIEWRLLRDEDFDGVTAPDADELYLKSVIAYRCPQSDHLWIFWDGIDQKPSLYTPTPIDHWRDG